MVTTKRGLKGREGVQVSYQGSVSISSIARKMDTMNAQEWCDAFMKGLENENTYYDKNWSLDRTYWFHDRDYLMRTEIQYMIRIGKMRPHVQLYLTTIS